MEKTFELWDHEKKKIVEVQAKKIGKEWRAFCPKHTDRKHPNLDINEEKGVFLCRACGWKGSLYKNEGKIKRVKPVNYEGIKEKVEEFRKNLNDDLRIFLKESRGLKAEVVEKYKIGFAKEHPKWGGNERLTIPISLNGKYVNIRFHSIKNEEPKDYPYDSNLPYAICLFPEDQLKNDELWLCEGELDALCLISQDLPAVTITGGAGVWKDEFAPLFRDKKVNIVYDCDEAGEKGAKRIAGILKDVAKKVDIIELGLKEGEDITDFFVTYGKTREDLLNKRKKSIEDVIIEFKDFSTMELPVKKVILNPWIKEQSIILISGWRGVGKTWLALSLLDAITRAKPFGPWETINPVNCLYLDGEMAGGDIQDRYRELNPKAQQKYAFYLYSEYYANREGVPPANLLNPNWRKTMKEIMLEKKVKLWVVDNISSVTPGIDENLKKDWDPINRWLIELRFAGISTILIHHTGKEGDQRGTSSREDNIDISILLKKPPNYLAEEGAKFDLIFSKTRIPIKDLKLITDTELELTRDKNGKLGWLYRSIKEKLKDEVIKLFDEGMKNKEIADYLEKKPSSISRIRAKAVKDGFLTKKNKLTEKGQLYLFKK